MTNNIDGAARIRQMALHWLAGWLAGRLISELHGRKMAA